MAKNEYVQAGLEEQHTDCGRYKNGFTVDELNFMIQVINMDSVMTVGRCIEKTGRVE